MRGAEAADGPDPAVGEGDGELVSLEREERDGEVESVVLSDVLGDSEGLSEVDGGWEADGFGLSQVRCGGW